MDSDRANLDLNDADSLGTNSQPVAKVRVCRAR
jgi:hypothetical protein